MANSICFSMRQQYVAVPTTEFHFISVDTSYVFTKTMFLYKWCHFQNKYRKSLAYHWAAFSIPIILGHLQIGRSKSDPVHLQNQ